MSETIKSSMNATEFFAFMQGWIEGLLNGTPVIQSHQDSPAPSGTYVVVECDGTWQDMGAIPSRTTEDESLPSPRVHQYTGTFKVWEVCGLGDNLRTIIEALDTEAARVEFYEHGVSVLNTTGPTPMPALDGAHWRREQLLELSMMWARGDSGNDNYIETVDVSRT